ncbi:hypothetical protein A7A76_07650 [Lysobacter enzymogenes]|uniref:hypothetical protein n=1 Tax=Lysobacter enzymogenes TaxID=69 RepID=UPI0019D1BDE8|nr:hypothetical protein [Lysobacter enzymogenes]MBN7138967.1 hypothetical protein [Lysobacter enzymogenes]
MVAMIESRPRGGVALRIAAGAAAVASLAGAILSADPVWIGAAGLLSAAAAICMTVLDGCGHADP